HPLAVDGEKAVYQHFTRQRVVSALQHGRPEQRVKIDDVLADDVVNSRLWVMPVGVKIPAGVATKFLGRGDVADRRIEADVEILIGLAGNFEAKVGTVATHIPVTQALVEPGLDKIPHLRLQPPGRTHPLAQKRFIGAEREKIVHRLADYRRRATDGT